jgi:hypothetical protein
MKKIFFILFLGLIAICGPPKLFASAKSTTVEIKKSFIFGMTEPGASIVIYNQDLSWTKTVAADQQPSLPEYKGKKNYTIDLSPTFARIPDTKIFDINLRYPKTPIPGFGRSLQSQA